MIVGYRPLRTDSTDFSGNGTNGTDTSMSYSAVGPLKGAGYFATALSSYISLGASTALEITPNIKTSAWVKQTGNNAYCIFNKANTSNYYGRQLMTNAQSGQPLYSYHFRTDGAAYSLGRATKTGYLGDSIWRYCVVNRYSDGTMNFWIDAIPTGVTMSATSSGALSYSSSNGYIGRTGQGNVGILGYLAGVKVDSAVPTNATVKNEYARIKGFI